MAPCHLFLVRHGESAYNAEGRIQGQADAPLTAAGREQATTIADLVAGLPADGVVASDLQRARDTAVLAGRAAHELDPRWRERGMGEWQDVLEADVGAARLRPFRLGELVPPQGETIPAFVARIGGAVDELRERGGSWVVFTHGGCVRAAVAHLTGADFNALAGPTNVSLTTLELAPRHRVLTYNWSREGGLPRASDPGGGHDSADDGQSSS